MAQLVASAAADTSPSASSASPNRAARSEMPVNPKRGRPSLSRRPGSEFVNRPLFDYCRFQRITFTRSRPYRQNDSAHVEQKNGAIVRALVGYDRYTSRAAYGNPDLWSATDELRRQAHNRLRRELHLRKRPRSLQLGREAEV